jgi:hypothetical protein
MTSEFKESYVIWGIVTVAVITLLYSVLLAGRFLS